MPKPLPPQALPNIARAVEDALVLHRQGRLAEAEKVYMRVLKALPDHFDALHLLGMIRLQNGKAGEAYRLIAAALKINPRSADALSNLGLVLHALKRDTDALASFDKALALVPDHADALNNRGNVLLNLKRPPEALACFDRVLALNPRHHDARVNRANALTELARSEEAIAEYDAALATFPGDAIAHFNRGNALLSLRRHAEAIAAYDKALAISPEHATALNNRGLARQTLNQHQEALADYAKAIALRKDDADAHFNHALALLTTGDYRRGFAEYEWRWRRTGMPPRRSSGKPLWLGEYPLRGKTILLQSEQGMGDTILFARYVPLLAQAGAKVVLEVQTELKPLLSHLEGVTSVVARGEPLPPFDVQCPMGSLPLAFKTELAGIPVGALGLRASQDRIEKWRPRLDQLARPRIAIAWAGNPAQPNDRNRSMPLPAFQPLLSAEARFVSIQRDLRAGNAEWLAREPRITHVGGELDDFADTAAVIALVDLVISVDTSVAHLPAAMGTPLWVLLAYSPDWRWTFDRETSPWFPAARLFRQGAPGDWDGVIAHVRAELKRGIAPAGTA